MEHRDQLQHLGLRSIAAEFGWNEAFDAGLGSSIGKGVELVDIQWRQKTDDGVLTLEGLEELVLGVGIVDTMHFHLAWERR